MKIEKILDWVERERIESSSRSVQKALEIADTPYHDTSKLLKQYKEYAHEDGRYSAFSDMLKKFAEVGE